MYEERPGSKALPLPPLLRSVSKSYGAALNLFGPISRGVGWRKPEEQVMRFHILAQVMAGRRHRGGVSINELGCGYGAMFDAFRTEPFMQDGSYWGYDINQRMLAQAEARISDPRARFIHGHEVTRMADYSLVSGTYNIKMEADDATWLTFIEQSLTMLWKNSRLGLAFNMMSRLGEKKEKNLYYADPVYFVEFCQQTLSHNVCLRHDYHMPEWTILVTR
ncbi:MAG: class I SAM-dependent methyltransferase [Rhodospirillales bacterium]|nr:class I SAM-dependent methyltransferase [Rhodospirillales bacterium]